MAANLGVERLVSWLGFRRDVPDVLSACDLFALPSIDEPFGRVFVEAMACGLPSVVTDVGDLSYFVRDGVTGFVVPAGDSGGLAIGLKRLLRDESLRRRMGRSARDRAVEEFSSDAWKVRMKEFYTGLLRGREVLSKS